MKYDFTTILDRKGKDAVAVDGMEKISGFVEEDSEFSGIPMWIADMNFPVVPKIQETISKRLQHPTFGYFSVREEYYDAIITWQRERNGVTDLNKEAIGYENGVLGGVISAISAFASAGDAVLLHSPTYIGFTKAITNSGFRIVHSPLKKDEDHVWRIDYEDMEEKIRTKNYDCDRFIMKLVIADEPTTSLDVTIQAQILELIKKLQKEYGTTVILITHDLGIVAGMADEIVVMYAGEIVEQGPCRDIFYHPHHPYTQNLLKAVPCLNKKKDEKLFVIEGNPPSLLHLEKGCPFYRRCQHCMNICMREAPPTYRIDEKHVSKCWMHHQKVSNKTYEVQEGDAS